MIWGDYAFPCFRLAKEFKKAPNLIAEELAEKQMGEYILMKLKMQDLI